MAYKIICMAADFNILFAPYNQPSNQDHETNEAGTIQFIENNVATDMTGEEICSMNFWGFSPSFFQTVGRKVYRLSE